MFPEPVKSIILVILHLDVQGNSSGASFFFLPQTKSYSNAQSGIFKIPIVQKLVIFGNIYVLLYAMHVATTNEQRVLGFESQEKEEI